MLNGVVEWPAPAAAAAPVVVAPRWGEDGLLLVLVVVVVVASTNLGALPLLGAVWMVPWVP